MVSSPSLDDALGCEARDVVIQDVAKFVASRVLSRDEKLEILEGEIKTSRRAGVRHMGAVTGDAAERLAALLRAERILRSM